MRSLAKLGIGALAAFLLATFFARGATRQVARAASLQPRAARLDDLTRDAVAPARLARANSLWGETSIAPCLIGAVWGARPAQAAFGAQMRLSVRAPVIARGAVTVRAQADIASTADADVAARYVAMEPGAAPVVRVLKIADFRARRRPARTFEGERRAA
jgi:hypothetical protein